MALAIDIEKESEASDIRTLAVSDFDRADLVNIILQRSEVLFDRPKYGQVIRSWTNGDSGPIEAEVDRLGTEIVRRAAAVIRAEYLALRPLLQELAPARLADIGCGYGFFDLFAAQDLNADLVLIDLESNEHRHFGFGDAGAAYSSLARARDFLVSNGVANARIETLNPTLSVPEEIPPVDLAVSFLSCGFHYPVDSYLPFLDKALKPGGAAIFDLRGHSARAQAKLLKRFGTLTDLDAPNKARRVLLRKDG